AWRDYIGTDISTPEARKRARFHFNWLDHGILRIWWKNFHKIAPDMYRANQPSPERLAQFKDMGIKTILNLRGTSEHSHYLFEREACETLGLTLIDQRLYAADLASRAEILALIDAMAKIEKPCVMHCKSGSDRTGFAAILYLHLFCDVPLAVAMKQLHWRHFHLRLCAARKTASLICFLRLTCATMSARRLDCWTGSEPAMIAMPCGRNSRSLDSRGNNFIENYSG
ncbi:MAG: dual specificity protein phosphatase family protein, partial [Alphaproteobacteria bacterium]|nr:dual specificity protein phosphatase family protein [Alphaproteobacteria bacterium]